MTTPIAVVAVVGVALALRLFLLTGQSLWYDEGVSAFMTTRGWPEIAAAAAADIHPPLYYWLLSAWARVFGAGEASLRGLSALLGTAAVWLTWRLGRRLLGNPTALAGAFLLAISPLAVQYGQEVRMYALAACLAAAATLAYTHLVPHPQADPTQPPRPIATVPALAYAALAAALLYAHYYGVLVLLAHQAHFWHVVAWGRQWQRVLPWLVASGLVALLYLPWLPHALRQTGYYPGLGTPQPPTALLVDAANVLSIGLATTRFELRSGLLPFLVLAAVGLALPVRGTAVPAPRLLLALWLALPVAAIVALSQTRPLYEPRFLLLVLPAWLLLVARGGVALAQHASRVVARDLFPGKAAAQLAPAALALLLALPLAVPTARSLASYYFDPTYARDDYRGLARTIQAREAPGDAVVLTAPGQVEVFSYYWRGEAPVLPLPRQRPLDEAETRAALQAVTTSFQRVWFVQWAAVEADPDGLVARWLDEHGVAASTQRFGTVELRLYDLQATASAPRVVS